MFTFTNGQPVPRLGQGTWYLGEDPRTEADELAALRTGIESGMTLIDTAEMYGEGLAEALVGKAIQGYDRDKLYLVSKVYPFNAGRRNIFTSCENSLRRMRTDHLDLYLLHWRGGVPLAETVDCMEELVRTGKIRAWGVSNLDVRDMEELFRVKNGTHCLTDQVLYHLGDRGVEHSLAPLLRRHNVSMMAYCPLGQAGRLRRGLLRAPSVQAVAAAHNATPYQVLLAFVLRDENCYAIPRTGNPAHTKQNAAAAGLTLTPDDLAKLERDFPKPARKPPLSIV